MKKGLFFLILIISIFIFVSMGTAQSADLPPALQLTPGSVQPLPPPSATPAPLQQAVPESSTQFIESGCPRGLTRDAVTKQCEGVLKTGELKIGTTGFTPSVNIPCVEIAGGSCPDAAKGIAQYVARLYQFSLMVVGLLSLAGLTLGAVKYILSAGNIVNQEEARDQMKAAVIGLLILLGAYLILRTINPDLVTLENPRILKVERVKDTTGGTTAKQNALTPTQAPSAPAGQQPAASGARYPTQTGCARNSSTYRVVINEVDYWACYAAKPGYDNINGVVNLHNR